MVYFHCPPLFSVSKLKIPFPPFLALGPESLEHLTFHGAAVGDRNRHPGAIKYGSGNLSSESLPIPEACSVGGCIEKVDWLISHVSLLC